MPKLSDTIVRRGGITAHYWSGSTTDISLGTTYTDDKHRVVLNFSIPSKGGGTTNIAMYVGDGDFQKLVAAMFDAKKAQGKTEAENS